MKVLVLQLVRYLTNDVVAHVPSYILRRAWYRNVLGISIGRQTTLLIGLRPTSADGRGPMGQGSLLGIRASSTRAVTLTDAGLSIGDNVSISPGVWILTDEHEIHDPRFPEVLATVRIGDYAFVGSKAMILPGVTVGRAAVIGDGAVVTKDVAPFEIVAGVPVRPIGQRRCEPRYQLDYRPAFE